MLVNRLGYFNRLIRDSQHSEQIPDAALALLTLKSYKNRQKFIDAKVYR